MSCVYRLQQLKAVDLASLASERRIWPVAVSIPWCAASQTSRKSWAVRECRLVFRRSMMSCVSVKMITSDPSWKL